MKHLYYSGKKYGNGLVLDKKTGKVINQNRKLWEAAKKTEIPNEIVKVVQLASSLRQCDPLSSNTLQNYKI